MKRLRATEQHCEVSETSSKKHRSSSSLIDIERERRKVVRHFACLKATSSSINEEEMQQVHSMLQARGLLRSYEFRLAPVMPELYTLLKEVTKRPADEVDFPAHLTDLIVSTGLMAIDGKS
jgi:hypothetical protein